MTVDRRESGVGLGIAVILVALLFIVGGFAVGAASDSVSETAQVILVIFGGLLLIFGAAIFTFTRLYTKTSADQAFVRTGAGGRKPIVDGGAFVVPVVHSVVVVSLQTMRLDVNRSGPDALITGDNLR